MSIIDHVNETTDDAATAIKDGASKTNTKVHDAKDTAKSVGEIVSDAAHDVKTALTPSKLRR